MSVRGVAGRGMVAGGLKSKLTGDFGGEMDGVGTVRQDYWGRH